MMILRNVRWRNIWSGVAIAMWSSAASAQQPPLDAAALEVLGELERQVARVCMASTIFVGTIVEAQAFRNDSSPIGRGVYSDVTFLVERNIRNAPPIYSMFLPGGTHNGRTVTWAHSPAPEVGRRYLIASFPLDGDRFGFPAGTRRLAAFAGISEKIAIPDTATLQAYVVEMCNDS